MKFTFTLVSLVVCFNLFAATPNNVEYSSNSNRSFDDFISGTKAVTFFQIVRGTPIQVDLENPIFSDDDEFWSQIARIFTSKGTIFAPLHQYQYDKMEENIASQCDIAQMTVTTELNGQSVSKVSVIFRGCKVATGEEYFRFDFKTSIRLGNKTFSRMADVIEQGLRFDYQYDVQKRGHLATNKICRVHDYVSASQVVSVDCTPFFGVGIHLV